MLKSVVAKIGVLRALLAATAILLIIAAPFSGGASSAFGWALARAVLAPTLFVMTAFVLPLDVVMTLIFMSDKQGAERARLRFVVQLEIGLFVAMMLAWLPLIVNLLGRG